MKINNNRKYVIVSRHGKGMLLFWGTITKDEDKRSFGGYTSDFSKCEKYTLKEIKDSSYNHFKEFKTGCNWRKFEDFYIKIEDLEKLGKRKMVVYI